MVYILDNDSADDLKQQFRNREDVQTIYWPWEKSQTQALSFLLASARGSCEWLLLSDADEYVLLGGREAGWQGRKTLKHLVARKRALGFAQVFFRYVTMGPSGRVFMPDMALAEAYLHKSERQKDNGKVVSLTDHEWVSSRIHRSYSGADNLLDCKGHFEDWDGMPLKSGDTPALVHFQFRSLQELIRKGRDGTASVLDSIGIETREFDMENPPGQFTYTDERLRFTFFRDFWRSVKQFGGMHDQNIVRTDESGMRCVVKRDVYSGRLTPQGCTSVKLF